MIYQHVCIALGVVISWKAISSRGQNERLKVVVGFENVHQFYADVREYDTEHFGQYQFITAPLVLRNKKRRVVPRNPVVSKLTPLYSKRVCAHIFRSGVFRRMDLERPELPNQSTTNITNTTTRFTYGWQTFTVRTPLKKFPELGFLCSIVNRVTKLPRIFYISREYDINIDFNPFSVGRFVFLKDKNQMPTVLHVAEEAAGLMEDSPAKLTTLYMESRAKDTDIARNVKENNLCQLNTNQRHQVCSSVVNAQYFEGIVEYYMPEESGEKSCEDISKDSWILEANDYLEEDFPLEESLIVCSVKVLGTENTFYLVARGNEADNVFVFAHESGRKIRLLNLSKHVRNVYEWKLPVTTNQKETDDTTSGSKVAIASESPSVSEFGDVPY